MPMKWYIAYSLTIGLCSIHNVNGRREAGLEIADDKEQRMRDTLRWPIIHSPQPARADLITKTNGGRSVYFKTHYLSTKQR